VEEKVARNLFKLHKSLFSRENMASIDSLKDKKGHISKANILKILPYGEDFLFLDEVVSLTKEKVVAMKKVRGSEEYMGAHFTSFALMPGALVMESIGQAATLLARYSLQNHEKRHIVLSKIKEAKFYAPILPKQEMIVEAVVRAIHNNKVLVEGRATVKGKQAAKASFILAIVDKKEFEEKHSA
jgi:3-hydroxyacyl-[acyl-carrier-protein] dehydratase